MEMQNIDKVEMTDFTIDESLIERAKAILKKWEEDATDENTERTVSEFGDDVWNIWKKYFNVDKYLPVYAADGLVSYKFNCGSIDQFEMFSYDQFVKAIADYKRNPEVEYFNILAAMVEISFICY
jgi:hypothetical protein